MSCSKGNSSKLTRNVLIIIMLGKFKNAISGRGPGSSTMCAILHELYDECRNSTYNENCDEYFKQNEECRDFKRDPKHQPLAELRKEWKKSINDQGFADAFDYTKHLREQDPAMCRIIYKSYKECISKGYDDCEIYRKYECPQFK